MFLDNNGFHLKDTELKYLKIIICLLIALQFVSHLTKALLKMSEFITELNTKTPVEHLNFWLSVSFYQKNTMSYIL